MQDDGESAKEERLGGGLDGGMESRRPGRRVRKGGDGRQASGEKI